MAILAVVVMLVMILTTVGRIAGGIILLCAGLAEWQYPGKGISLLIELMERFRPGVRASVERSILRTTKTRAIASAGLGICLLVVARIAASPPSSPRAPMTGDFVSTTRTPATPPGAAGPASGAAPSQPQADLSPHVQAVNPPGAPETPKLLAMETALRDVHNPMKLCGKAVVEAPSIHCYQTGAKGTILCRTEDGSLAVEMALNNLRENNISVQTITAAMALGQLVKSNGCFTDDNNGVLAATPDFHTMYILTGRYQGQVLYSRAPQWNWETCRNGAGQLNGPCPRVAPSWPRQSKSR